MRYVTKQLIGILVPLAAALGLLSLIASGWDENAAATIGDLLVRLFIAMLNGT